MRAGIAWLALAVSSFSQSSNPIVVENALPGRPQSEWDIVGNGDPTIQGFATDISVNRGQTINFKIDTTATAYRIDIYRLGYYGGLGARKVTTVTPTATLPQVQPPAVRDAATGLFDCGNWAVSATWGVPANAASGVYIARLVRLDTSGASHIVFIVRDDAGQSDILFQTSDPTWQAYNDYGGSSLYVGNGPAPDGRSYKVSYNRPDNTRVIHDGLFTFEHPMIRWLELNGYNVSYASGLDTDRRGAAALQTHKILLSVGHDEYWSGGQRANVVAARDAGLHLAFFSGNQMFWKTRWENSIAGPSTPFRTLVCYKETHANAKIDPTAAWTGTWRDPRFSPPADGGRPENAVSGQIFTVNAWRYDPILISSDEGQLRFWRNTGLDALVEGTLGELPAGVLGNEWDEALDNGFQPPGLFRLSTTTIAVGRYLQNFGSTFGPGVATHSLTLYRHPSGALVFGSGTEQWSWGLDATHDVPGPSLDYKTQHPGPTPDWRMKQATVNLFADMGAQPGTLQSGLILAAQSTDGIAPTSTILPPPGLTVPAWTPLTIYGTASDSGGGRPAAVELSLDGGVTWHPVNGAADWSATCLTNAPPGPVTIKSRAIDDSGRMETPGPGLSLTVSGYLPEYTLWDAETVPTRIDSSDAAAVELGVRFQAARDGWITALRFYKSGSNTGVHLGNLWANNGALLATVTFANETASGWQQARLPTPLPIAAGTTYIASYHTDVGHYSDAAFYFLGTGVDRPPLSAPADGVAGANGVYSYGPSAFPSNSSQSTNYWVDVVYAPSLSPDTTPPIVTELAPGPGASNVSLNVPITAQFSEALASSSVLPATFTLKDAQNNSVPASVTYDAVNRLARLQPSVALNGPATYTATVQGGATGVSDLAGNRLAGDIVWSFTTTAPPIGPFTLWAPQTVPTNVDSTDVGAVELGVRFQAERDGWITALRFYKSAANTGVHIGNLWTNNGALLGTVTFAGETTSGWQQAQLGAPVPITAGTSYIASYHTDSGHYSDAVFYFAGTGLDRPPLSAPADGVAGANGLYRYGSSAFPSNTAQSNNYWVDVVFIMPGQAASPVFTPPGGIFAGPQSVTLSTTSPAARLYYTIDGSTPTKSSTRYTSPIVVSTSTTIKAIATVSGWMNSAVASASYSLQLGPPTAPSALTAVAAFANQINLSWNDSATNESGFKIERKIGVGGTYAQVAIAPANATSFSDTGVNASTTYFYRVRATNAAGDSAYSNTATASTPLSSPVSPPWSDRDIGAVGIAGSASQSNGAYTVKGSGTDIWDIADAFHFVYQPLTGNGEIIARVVSLQNTDPWAKAGVMIREDLTATSAHALMAVTPGNGLAFQRRVAPGGVSTHTAGALVTAPYWVRLVRSGNTFTGYASNNGLSWTVVASDTIAIAGTVQIGLAVTAHNNSVLSTAVLDNVSVTTQPNVPGSLAALAVSSSQINLSWADVSNETGFKIERKTGAGGTYAQIGTVGAGVTTYNNTGLSATTTYFYRVRSTNSVGDSAYSNEANATTLVAVPAAPSGLTASAVSSSQINLSWADVANENGFKIERKTGAGGTYAQIATVGAGVTTYSNTGLSATTTYFYRVRATNAGGDSPYSTEVSATTPVPLPAAPTGLTASAASSSQINLSWTDVANENGFKIERKTGAGGTYAQIATVGAGVTTYNNTGLSATTTYFYRVRASNAAGDSFYSTEASATTLAPVPLAPTGLTASAVSSSQINLSWVDVANETGFKIERKTGAGGTYAQIAAVGAGVTAYNNTGLSAGTAYFYRVRATSAAGDSAYSTEANATTLGATFRAAASAGATSGVLTLTINKPAGTQQGDVMVASIAFRPNTVLANVAGWTLIRRIDNANSNANSLAVYYKVAGASEPASYAWTFNTSTGSAGGIRSFSGVDTVNPIDVEAGQNTPSGLTHTAPSVTTRFAGDMIVTSHAFSSSATFASPAGMTEAFDVSSDAVPASGGEAIQGNYLLQPAIAATGTQTATASNDADVGNAHTLALKAR